MSLYQDILTVEKEMGRTSPDYAMFTNEGNAKVARIVALAKDRRWTWARTQSELYFLADSDAQLYGEATDTAVREAVYDAIGAGRRNETFYC